MPAYLAYMPAGADPDTVQVEGTVIALDECLWLIESRLTRSRLYHQIKWALPVGAALLVAPLAGEPKFKAMAPGAMKATRQIFG